MKQIFPTLWLALWLVLQSGVPLALAADAPASAARGADSKPRGVATPLNGADTPASADAKVPAVDFQRDIRPILADTCYTCHGPDAAKRKSALRLDSREGAMIDLGGYKAIVAGKPDDSPLYERITSENEDERMPPRKSGRKLSPQQIELVRRWIADGARWKGHWSFAPPSGSPPPAVKLRAWPRNPIDAFVLARLEEAGLAPSAEAMKAALIRRLSLDLTGLPPTLAEVNAFVADNAPDAYEKLVDRLFASPRYGEHMAVEWLDAARYSDTNGYQNDDTRTMWPWRDWVVDSMNQNMPFDQFTIEQLAGDLLPGATLRQKLATGFHRNHPLNGEGGRIAEESRVEYVVDRVDTTATVWLGMTAGCARCHDHKYDPVTQREFYQLYAFFNNVTETGGVDKHPNASPLLAITLPNKRLNEINEQIARLEKKLLADTPELIAAQEKWEAELKVTGLATPEISAWRVLGPFTGGDFDATFKKDFGLEKVRVPAEEYAGVRWQPRKFKDGQATPLGLAPASALYLARTIVAPNTMTIGVSLGSDDAIKVWLNGEQLLAHEVRRAVAEDQEQLRLKLKEGENRLLMKIVNGGGPAGFYFALATPGPTKEVVAALKSAPAVRSAAEREAVKRFFRSVHPPLKSLSSQFAALRAQQAKEKSESTVNTMIMEERPHPRDTFVLYRGQYDRPDPKQQVTSDVPACLPALPTGVPRNRLALARWLVDPKHPLTSRVTVNRYWQHFFGAGLVQTTEDFGSQGEPPSHPELLDWLATKFQEGRWDVKAIQRLIVTSATYRQTATTTPDRLERDPYNRLLSRGPRFRLTSLALRDQALALGGLLIERQGGPPVKPYQPDGVWQDFSLGKIKYNQDHGESLYRRSVYTFWRRSVAPTTFFDTTDRQVCTVRPSRTNSPLHALTLLNDVTFVEAARGMAERVLKQPERAPAARLAWAFHLATCRQPTPSETAVLLASLERAEKQFRNDPAAVKKLLTIGESLYDTKLDAVELASYTTVMNVILNLDEVLTKG